MAYEHGVIKIQVSEYCTDWRTRRVTAFHWVKGMAKTWTVNMSDPNLGDVFVPDYQIIAVGDTVNWVNVESTGPPPGDPHTATSNGHTGEKRHCIPTSSEVFDSGDVPPGGTFQHTFTSTGFFAYHCERHASCSSGTQTGMIGIVVVV